MIEAARDVVTPFGSCERRGARYEEDAHADAT